MPGGYPLWKFVGCIKSGNFCASKAPFHVGAIEILPCKVDCNKYFGSNGTLLEHIDRIHKRLLLHKCDQCNKSFASKGDLNGHTNGVHLQLKPHVCTGMLDLCLDLVPVGCSAPRKLSSKFGLGLT